MLQPLAVQAGQPETSGHQLCQTCSSMICAIANTYKEVLDTVSTKSTGRAPPTADTNGGNQTNPAAKSTAKDRTDCHPQQQTASKHKQQQGNSSVPGAAGLAAAVLEAAEPDRSLTQQLLLSEQREQQGKNPRPKGANPGCSQPQGRGLPDSQAAEQHAGGCAGMKTSSLSTLAAKHQYDMTHMHMKSQACGKGILLRKSEWR